MPWKNKYLWLWLLLAVVSYFFHEAWRDEAQAWLVAKSARSFQELLNLSSLEATPPLYYLILWPFAKLAPQSFPFLQWIVSLLGSFLAVGLLLSGKIFKSPIIGILLAFSFTFGFEFACVSRLYGWGFFFLLWGLYLDEKKQSLQASVLFSLSALTQGPFGVAVASLYLFRLLEDPKNFFKRYLFPIFILSLAALFFIYHNHLAADLREWKNSFGFPKRLSLLGGTLASPFIHIPSNLGFLGFIVSVLAYLSLPKKTRLPYLFFLTVHALIFAFIYGHFAGAAKPRHGMALFLMTLYFWQKQPQHESFIQVKSFKQLWPHFKARILLKDKNIALSELFILLLLTVSFFSHVFYRVEDILFPYSDAQAASQVIKARGFENVKIFSWDEQDTYALQTYLDTSIYVGSNLQEVVHPQYTRERMMQRQEDFKNGISWELFLKNCPPPQKCFFVSKVLNGEPPANLSKNFIKVFAGKRTISDESLNVFEIVP